MSKYSTEVRYLIEGGYDLNLKDYPIFDENYRTPLNDKILNHYYFHEIGFETAARFKHYLNATMNEVMPYYNQLLKSELLEINPLLSFEKKMDSSKNVINEMDKTVVNETNQSINNTTDLENVTTGHTDETQTMKNDMTQNSSLNSSKAVDGSNSSNDQDVFYDTPNGSLGDITDSSYATTVNKKTNSNAIDEDEVIDSNEAITKGEDQSNVTDSSTINNTNTSSSSDTSNDTTNNITEGSNLSSNEISVITENGFNIPLSDLILRYRETFLNIDKMIIDELKDLFMMIY